MPQYLYSLADAGCRSRGGLLGQMCVGDDSTGRVGWGLRRTGVPPIIVEERSQVKFTDTTLLYEYRYRVRQFTARNR